MIDEVDLHCDIVAKVPFEISEMILQYLPLDQVFRAQRVSRKWRETLASPKIVANHLRSWYPDSDTPGVPDGLSETIAASLKAEHVDAYQRGKAYIMENYSFGTFIDDLDRDLVAYADGVVAWIEGTERCMCRSLDLKTGNELSFRTDDSTPIIHIALSSSMIAAMGSAGMCYLWTFREQKSMSLRIPPALRMEVLLSDNSLVVPFYPTFPSGGAQVEIITWTLNGQRTHSFSLALNRIGGNDIETKFLLDKEGASFILLERPRVGCTGEIEYVHFTRASLTGVILAQGLAEGPRRGYHEDNVRENILARTYQHATTWAFVIFSSNESSSEFVRVRYDFDRDRVEFDTHLIKDIDRSNAMSEFFFSKNAAYYRHNWFGREVLRVIDFSDSICTQAPMSTLLSSSESWPQQGLEEFYSARDGCVSLLDGDENFLVDFNNKGMLVWSFDKSVRIFNQDPFFRLRRDSTMASAGKGTPPASDNRLPSVN